jgi:hypothetical protein
MSFSGSISPPPAGIRQKIFPERLVTGFGVQPAQTPPDAFRLFFRQNPTDFHLSVTRCQSAMTIGKASVIHCRMAATEGKAAAIPCYPAATIGKTAGADGKMPATHG